MAISVVADQMPLGDDAPYYFRVRLSSLADDEESRLCPVSFEGVEDFRRMLRMRAVIECQRHDFVPGACPVQGFDIDP